MILLVLLLVNVIFQHGFWLAGNIADSQSGTML